MATFIDDISGKKWLDIDVAHSTITTVLIQLSYNCYCSCGTDIPVYTVQRRINVQKIGMSIKACNIKLEVLHVSSTDSIFPIL